MVKTNPVRGKPKSGRVWKSQKNRLSSVINVKSLHKPWSVRTKERAEMLSVKKFQQELKEAAEQEKQAKKLRREENLKRREENALKSEIVQKITNTAKIKKMKKKQLRQIKKR